MEEEAREEENDEDGDEGTLTSVEEIDDPNKDAERDDNASNWGRGCQSGRCPGWWRF